MAEQLILNLPTRPALERGDFFVSDSNAMSLAAVEDWRNWPGRKHLIIGPEGSGKTHLCHVWANQAQAQIIDATTLGTHSIDELAHHNVAVDNVPLIAGCDRAQTALFHLHNMVLANGNALLLTGRSQPHLWGITLADLTSRLQGTGSSTLIDPDDTLFMVVITKLFADRQMFPTPDVIHYLTNRLDRSFAAARHAVDAIDRAALAQHRPISRPLAAQVIEKLHQDKELP